jgi:hypothetical protein
LWRGSRPGRAPGRPCSCALQTPHLIEAECEATARLPLFLLDCSCRRLSGSQKLRRRECSRLQGDECRFRERTNRGYGKKNEGENLGAFTSQRRDRKNCDLLAMPTAFGAAIEHSEHMRRRHGTATASHCCTLMCWCGISHIGWSGVVLHRGPWVSLGQISPEWRIAQPPS